MHTNGYSAWSDETVSRQIADQGGRRLDSGLCPNQGNKISNNHAGCAQLLALVKMIVLLGTDTKLPA